MCDECKYIPGKYVNDPKRCYREHMKKNHRRAFEVEFGKVFVIHEEDDIALDMSYA